MMKPRVAVDAPLCMSWACGVATCMHTYLEGQSSCLGGASEQLRPIQKLFLHLGGRLRGRACSDCHHQAGLPGSFHSMVNGLDR